MTSRSLRIALSLAVLSGPLASCAPGQMPMIGHQSVVGPDDGSDSCRPQAVALESTGNFFAADILAGAATGALGGGLLGGLASGNWKGALIGAGAGAAVGAAAGYWNALQKQRYDEATLDTRVAGDLSNDNAQISRTQEAFNQLMACRFQQADAINASLAAGQIDRPTAMARMAVVHGLAQRDVALARSIDGHIEERGQQFAVAADNIAPGTSANIAQEAGPEYSVQVSRPTELRLSPSEDAPHVATVPAKSTVRVTRKRGDYALVESNDGKTGYVPVSDLHAPAKKHGSRSLSATPAAKPADAPATGSGSTQVATLAGSNAARRDDFAQSVAVSEKAVNSGGFEVAG